MRQFPLSSSILIVLLLAAIFAVLKFLPSVLDLDQPAKVVQVEQPQRVIEKNVMQVSGEFRFSSKPKVLKILDKNEDVVFETSAFSFDSEHQVEGLLIPHDAQKVSELKLIVEWDEPATDYHFFSMRFYGHDRANFGAGVASDINETIFLKW